MLIYIGEGQIVDGIVKCLKAMRDVEPVVDDSDSALSLPSSVK
jgi:hypothetical protein